MTTPTITNIPNTLVLPRVGALIEELVAKCVENQQVAIITPAVMAHLVIADQVTKRQRLVLSAAARPAGSPPSAGLPAPVETKLRHPEHDAVVQCTVLPSGRLAPMVVARYEASEHDAILKTLRTPVTEAGVCFMSWLHPQLWQQIAKAEIQDKDGLENSFQLVMSLLNLSPQLWSQASPFAAQMTREQKLRCAGEVANVFVAQCRLSADHEALTSEDMSRFTNQLGRKAMGDKELYALTGAF